VRGKHVSFTRGKRNSKPSTSLIKIESCDSPKDAEFYFGKRIAYVYKVCILLTYRSPKWVLMSRRNGLFGGVRFE
jgi:ribosomal protein L35AE/L33A